MRGNILHYSLDFSSITKINYRAAVTFADGVESQNVVGYQTFDTEIGFNTMSPTFISVGNTDTETKLADIKLGDGATSYTDNIQILDADGNALTQYYWVGEGELDGENPAGWTEDLGTISDATIPVGAGFFLECNDTIQVTFAGQVHSGGISLTSVAGFNAIGNSSPVPVAVQSIRLGEGATSYTDNIQILDADGNAMTQYYWVGEGELDGENPAGWTEDLGTLTDAEIPAGVGFFLEMAAEDVSITMPTAR